MNELDNSMIIKNEFDNEHINHNNGEYNTVDEQINHNDNEVEYNNEDNNVDNNNNNDDNNNIELENYCIICNEEAVVDSNHNLYHLYPTCRHSIHFGIQCLKQYISVKIEDSAISNLCCPLPGCKERLNEKLIQELSTDQEYQKYQEDVKCLNVNSNWNILKRVGNFVQDLFSNVQQLFRRVSLDSKRCPKCRYIIEKDGGCNHMTCRKCMFEFHWCCGQNYSRGHDTFICNFIRYVLPIVAIAIPLLLVCKILLSSILSWFCILSFLKIIAQFALYAFAAFLGGTLLDNNINEATWYHYALTYAAALIAETWLETCNLFNRTLVHENVSFRIILTLASSMILEYNYISDYINMKVIESVGGIFSFATLVTLASFATGSKLFFLGGVLSILDHSSSSKYRRSSRWHKDSMAICQLIFYVIEVFDLYLTVLNTNSIAPELFLVISAFLLFFVFIKGDPDNSFRNLNPNWAIIYYSGVSLIFFLSCTSVLVKILTSSFTTSILSFVSSLSLGVQSLAVPTLKFFGPFITYSTIPLVMLMMNPIRRDVLFCRFNGTGKIEQITSKVVSLLYLVFLYIISTRVNAGVYEKYIYMSINLMLDYIYTKMKMEKSNEKPQTSPSPPH